MMKVPDHLYVLATHKHVTRIAAMHFIFTRIGCTILTCDMYMCRLRHINDPVLSSLKMEGIRLLYSYVLSIKCSSSGGIRDTCSARREN
jgi:hypothetical protein